MSEDEISFALAGERVFALGDRALFWPRKGALFVADVHFGKDATFRRALRWVPPGTTSTDLTRLSRLIERYRATRLIILGDAFHSEHAREDATFLALRDWRRRLGAEVVMVKGNHDRRAGEMARDLDFALLEEDHPMPPFTLRHHPATISGESYVLCGHLHPVVMARGPARQSLRVPCFWAGARQCVLPAFGGFTGGYPVRPAAGDRVILAVEGRVIDAPK
jgi:DNA ligase-associated metallophosphoesterase